MRFLLTIPARNEESTIAEVIGEYMEEASRLGIQLSVQVVDDGSTDNTVEIIRNINVPVCHVENSSGLAEIFRKEMELALKGDADVFIHADADGQHSAKDLHLLINKLSEGFDLVLGSRMHGRPLGMPDIHYAANILLSEIVSILSGQRISDSQTGYRAIRRRVAEFVRISSSFTYTQEQIIRAARAGFKVCEVSITARPRRCGVSRLVRNPFHYLKHAFSDLEDLSRELSIPLNVVTKQTDWHKIPMR